MYVLDTNTLIYFFKGIGQIARRMNEVSPDEIAIPTVVLFELYVGSTAKSRGATLITHNVKEFSRVDNMLIEDWY